MPLASTSKKNPFGLAKQSEDEQPDVQTLLFE